MIVSSNGVFYAKAWDALKRFAEKAQIPVVESGAMKGQFSDASPLSANAAPAALASADLVDPGRPALHADRRRVRVRAGREVHPHRSGAEDIGRNLPIDLGIVSCEKAALEALADAVPQMTHDAWVAEIAAARKKFEDQNLEYYKTGLELHRRRAPGGDRQGARRLPLSRQDAAGADDRSRRAATASRATCAASCAASGRDRS